MRPPRKTALAILSALVLLSSSATRARAQSPLGIFEDHQDVGKVLNPGSATFDSSTATYTVSGSGDNMWFGEDDFHFVWKKVSGDISLTSDIAFLGATGNNHRKAVLMIRQTLDGASKSADLAVHGDGLTSLQFRDENGANTHEVESSLSAPKTVSIQKRGDLLYAFVTGKDGKLQPAGASTRLALSGDFYVGIGVCSHDKNVTERAVFSNVKLVKLNPLSPAAARPTLYSTLETITVASTDRRVAYVAPIHFEAPNWSRDGKFLLFNANGGLQRLNIGEDIPISVATDPRNKCNNDHGISPDGQFIAISDQSDGGSSSIYILPVAGGAPRRVTKSSPSYWHGWSPDGSTLAFTGQRNGNFDIYTIPVAGGGGDAKETRLTNAPGLDDGPEYSPDGAYIYFNSERSGHMQIWRMKPDGTAQEQVLTSETNDWFPHISPDGKSMVFLSYAKDVTGHPGEKDVQLNLMSLADKKVRLLAKLFGGQGTINVPSWSPDSKKLAFVSYELLPSSE